ncbi:helix-turn-helix transcriptional regulator [Neobacillus sp. PS3-34]|uniref:helix-turn-helix domain-containing protein n=1 Tax=Neobacillus sp. PS3-34 TaxID=3070678 RepID=UPI0027E0A0F6|nr:helix-turn-helix transcriptional regulator [Neobacillus sp. PS3-34]WML48988.1 helix-turn-helix transcriptional regulator [Neobacillus sp. PS3-34]
MIEGKIIKFYREKAGSTQGQLGEGICSVTHLSKIERGITEYSREITYLLSKRLNISLEDEKDRYQHLHLKLKLWHDALVMQQNEESEVLKNEIEKEILIQLEDFRDYYQLLLARHYLSHHKLESALLIIQALQKNEASLSPQDRNMLKHVQGIYYFLTGEYRDCIHILISIDQSQYNHFEYYYHLALSYHTVNANIISYYYAEKVLDYFQKTLNIKRIIDTEMIMIIQLNAREHHDFKETKERYEQLIRTCDAINDVERKSKLYHNLAFEFYRRKKYNEATHHYLESLNLVDENTPHYLYCLDGYISSCHKGNLLSKEELLELAEKGYELAKPTNSYFCISFQLHLYKLNNEEDKYYQFIEMKALPYLKNIGYTMLIEHYEKKLFQYYNEMGETQKALELAQSYMHGKKSYYEYE